MPGKSGRARRSGCPVSISLDILGDRWSLLIIRDAMVRGFRTFGEFQRSGEGIATNILADRLQKLQDAGIFVASAEPTDSRRINYTLTEKGVDLAPVLLELLFWGAKHEETSATAEVMAMLKGRKEGFLEEVRRRWQEGDRTPLLPAFKITETGDDE